MEASSDIAVPAFLFSAIAEQGASWLSSARQCVPGRLESKGLSARKLVRPVVRAGMRSSYDSVGNNARPGVAESARTSIRRAKGVLLRVK